MYNSQQFIKVIVTLGLNEICWIAWIHCHGNFIVMNSPHSSINNYSF